MSYTLKIGATILAIFASAMFLFSYNFADAGPSVFTPPVSTAPATTTKTYMSFGMGTTTLTLDTYYASTLSNNTKADSALLLFQVYSTSTISSPTVNVAIEYSNDNVEWFPMSSETTALASSTGMTGSYADYSFSIATTTATTRIGGTGSTTPSFTAERNNSLQVETPTRYIRFVFFTPASGSGKYSLWASVQPVKERQ